jgi:peptidoglycan biosynthesis protein MviN/MurJ (putative lipid II flippase)
MYYVISAVWVVVTIVSYIQGNRKLPIAIAVLGLLAQIGIWMIGIGYLGVAVLALLTLIGMFSVPEIFLRNKF